MTSESLNNIVSVKVGDTLAKALRLMIKHNISHIPVEYYNRYEGVVSKTTITDYLAGCLLTDSKMTLDEAFNETCVGKFVGTPLLSVNIEDFFEQSLKKLVSERVGSVLIFDGEKCVGLLTKTDIICALKDYLQLGTEVPVKTFIKKWLIENSKVKFDVSPTQTNVTKGKL